MAAGRGRGVDFGAYGLADALVWQSAADKTRAASTFARVSYSPSDRNVIDFYADAGVTLAAPFRGRDGDLVGLAVGVARISPRLRTAATTLLRSGASATVPPTFEGVVELSYKSALIGPLTVQPNFQYIIQSASSALSIQTAGGKAPDALVLGIRSSISF